MFDDEIYCTRNCLVAQVSHPYITTGKIIVVYIVTFIFLDSKCENIVDRTVAGIP